jgi:hypothetical protein
MLAFPALNQTVCCKSLLCTECFVEVQCISSPPGKAACPYCKSHPLTVKVGRNRCRRRGRRRWGCGRR